jgi:hypothetical protein
MSSFPSLDASALACSRPLVTGRPQPLAIASGLSVGKEGPSVHMACCVGNVIGGFFERFATSHSASVCARTRPFAAPETDPQRAVILVPCSQDG